MWHKLLLQKADYLWNMSDGDPRSWLREHQHVSSDLQVDVNIFFAVFWNAVSSTAGCLCRKSSKEGKISNLCCYTASSHPLSSPRNELMCMQRMRTHWGNWDVSISQPFFIGSNKTCAELIVSSVSVRAHCFNEHRSLRSAPRQKWVKTQS